MVCRTCWHGWWCNRRTKTFIVSFIQSSGLVMVRLKSFGGGQIQYRSHGAVAICYGRGIKHLRRNVVPSLNLYTRVSSLTRAIIIISLWRTKLAENEMPILHGYPNCIQVSHPKKNNNKKLYYKWFHKHLLWNLWQIINSCSCFYRIRLFLAQDQTFSLVIYGSFWVFSNFCAACC